MVEKKGRNGAALEGAEGVIIHSWSGGSFPDARTPRQRTGLSPIPNHAQDGTEGFSQVRGNLEVNGHRSLRMDHLAEDWRFVGSWVFSSTL